MGQIFIKLPDSLYKRDPQSTPLGQRILKKGVDLMDSLGFRAFHIQEVGD